MSLSQATLIATDGWASALPADEVAFGKWQEHRVDSGIVLRTVYERGLVAGGSHVIDDQHSARHEARDHYLIGFAVDLRRLEIGEAERDVLETGNVFESVAMNGLDRTCCSGAGNVLSCHDDFLFIQLDGRQCYASRTSSER